PRLSFLVSPATPSPYSLSLPDALPIWPPARAGSRPRAARPRPPSARLPWIAPPRAWRCRAPSARPGGPPARPRGRGPRGRATRRDRKSTRLNSSHGSISYAVFCLKNNKLQLAQRTQVLVEEPNDLAPNETDLQQKKKERERDNATKSDVIANMAHELTTPRNASSG